MLNLSGKTSLFKYSKILKDLIHVRELNNSSGTRYIFHNNLGCYKIWPKTQGEISAEFFIWKKEYGEHSKHIGKIIHEGWRKGSTLYASAEYIDGKLQYHEPKDPIIPNFGLASGHLMKGYSRKWQLYKTVRAESVTICNEIKEIIASFENKVLEEIDKQIQTNDGNRKLERKTEEQVYNWELGSKVYPDKFDFNSLYLYPKILSEIFQEVNNRNNNKKKRNLWMNEIAGYWDLIIREPNDRGKTIALGDKEIMEELKRRVEELLDDPQIHKLVREYRNKKSQLQTRENADRLDAEINGMWNEINSHSAFLKGEASCQNLAKCRPKSKGSEDVYYTS